MKHMIMGKERSGDEWRDLYNHNPSYTGTWHLLAPFFKSISEKPILRKTLKKRCQEVPGASDECIMIIEGSLFKRMAFSGEKPPEMRNVSLLQNMER